MDNEMALTVSGDCRLIGAPPAVINALKESLTLPNPKYQAAKKYGRWVGKKFPQKLYFFKDLKKGFVMPRGFAREAVLICLNKAYKPEIIDNRRLLPEVDFCFKGQMRPYQQTAVNDILTRDFGVLEAGTGSGKTVMALQVIALRRQPTIIIVHTKELLYQWAKRIKEFLGVDAELIGDGKFSVGPITVAIVNSARKHLKILPESFGHLLVDECHRVPASLFTDVVNAFDAQYTLGLSATAYRREDVLTKLIYFYMGNCVHRVDQQALVEDGAIIRPKVIIRHTSFYYKYKDDYAAMMTALSFDDARNEQIADDVVKVKGNSGVILVVTDRVAHCESLAELIVERGKNAELLTGQVNSEKRADIVAAISENRLSVIVATLQLIGEGFDAPGLSTLFLASPIKFSGRLKQVIGRIMRPAKGKQAVVYDYVDEKVSILKHSASERQLVYDMM